jgi:hypothetical protein
MDLTLKNRWEIPGKNERWPVQIVIWLAIKTWDFNKAIKLFFNTENGDLPVDGMGDAVLRQTQMGGNWLGECEGRKKRNVDQFGLTDFWN